MDKKRSTALALAVAVALGVAGLMWQDLFQGTPVAAQAKPAAKADTHKDGETHQEGETHEEGEEAQPEAEEHAEEEGKVELSAEQIKAADIQLAEAAPRNLSSLLTLPGRSASTRTAPRTSCRARPGWWSRWRSISGRR